MPKRIFIGGLSLQTTSEEVKKMFSQAGTVLTAHVEMSRDSNGHGHGYVEMSTDEATLAAISRFNGQELNGSRIVIRDTVEARNIAPVKGSRSQALLAYPVMLSAPQLRLLINIATRL